MTTLLEHSQAQVTGLRFLLTKFDPPKHLFYLTFRDLTFKEQKSSNIDFKSQFFTSTISLIKGQLRTNCVSSHSALCNIYPVSLDNTKR